MNRVETSRTIIVDGIIFVQSEFIEGASPPRANTVQPIVGPPDVVTVSPALARPATLSEVISFVEEQTQRMVDFPKKKIPVETVFFVMNAILQRLGTLDRGPIAQCPSELENHRSVMDYLDSLTVD